jgi:hypothetical protein
LDQSGIDTRRANRLTTRRRCDGCSGFISRHGWIRGGKVIRDGFEFIRLRKKPAKVLIGLWVIPGKSKERRMNTMVRLGSFVGPLKNIRLGNMESGHASSASSVFIQVGLEHLAGTGKHNVRLLSKLA